MTWWHIAVLISVVSFWTLASVSFGGNIAARIAQQRDIAEQAKWRIPDKPTPQ